MSSFKIIKPPNFCLCLAIETKCIIYDDGKIECSNGCLFFLSSPRNMCCFECKKDCLHKDENNYTRFVCWHLKKHHELFKKTED